MIIGNPKEDQLIICLSALEKKLKREINYRIYTKKDLELKIKQKDYFVKNILQGAKLFLIGSKNDLPKF